MNDLNKAIELSSGHGKAATQAYTQRGLLNKLDGEHVQLLIYVWNNTQIPLFYFMQK
jgi:hypothetical protein